MKTRLRWWRWLPPIALISGAGWAANLALGNWWAAGGPSTPHANIYEHRGNLSCAMALLFVLLAVLLLVINLWQRRSIRSGE